MNSTIRRCLDLNVMDSILLHRLIINNSLKMSIERFHSYESINVINNGCKMTYAIMRNVVSSIDVINPFSNHPVSMLSYNGNISSSNITFKVDDSSIDIIIHCYGMYVGQQFNIEIHLTKIRDDYYRGTVILRYKTLR